MVKPQDRRWAAIALVGYSLLLIYWMLFGFGRAPHDTYMYNLKPFLTICQFLRAGDFMSARWLVNMIGNIGVFIPFGLLMPMVFGGKLRREIFLFLSGVVILEILQLVLKRGSFDVDDMILNTTGFLLGFGIYKLYDRMLSKPI
ncbi:VanZ family protein [Paenibacillus sp. MBLB2552]|uniref:VanZ family protein n=1 Tax=Paenibacillus mellifer TaxID=2937794 RepID=A0A9X2BRV3_9BACL|nr:VanZ family protein [Paenibacillus mellifer]MCK8487700.1 VanZ family protein [Paenibacillus mellifer]